jgi:catechol-2,3-dioxygenase
MVDFYEKIAGLEPVYYSEEGAWRTNDEENHRIALLALPDLKPPTDKGHTIGLHHTAFEHGSFDQWLSQEFLKSGQRLTTEIVGLGTITQLLR